MRDRKKRNIIIGALCCLLVFMGIGYAILSQTLNISGIANMKGNWNVKITNMELLSENKTGRAVEVSHSFTDTTATFTADLYMPGDSIEYRVTVENQGNIDAVLKSITPTTTNKSEGIKFSHSEIDNTVLTAGKTITFTMKVEFLEDATSIPKVENVKYNLELVYVQYNGGEYTPAVEPAEESCFMISDDGTLLSYDRSCGTDNVVIPAKINNIPVKRVAPLAFASLGVSNAQTSTGEYIYIFKNEEAKTKYIENMRKEGSNDAEINEIMQTSYIYGSSELSTLKLKTVKEYALESDQKFKVYKDSSNTIKIEKTSTDYNMIYFSSNDRVYPYEYYCTTNDVCDLLKEHIRGKDPARNYGITDNSYYEYLYPYEIIPNTSSSHRFGMLNNLEYISFMSDYLYGDGVFKKLDFSQAIYMEELTRYATVMPTSDDSEQLISKVILPPNVKTIDLPFAKEVIFPSNSITEVIFLGAPSIESIVFPKTLKVIGNNAFQENSLTSVVIPSSVVRIGSNAFAARHLGQGNIASLKFEKDSHLIAIYGNERDDYDEGVFGRNKLSNVIIPKSVEYIGYHAFAYNNLTTVSFEANSKLKYMDSSVFWGNSNPINLTLTTPTDLSNWPAGTNDNITVVYER